MVSGICNVSRSVLTSRCLSHRNHLYLFLPIELHFFVARRSLLMPNDRGESDLPAVMTIHVYTIILFGREHACTSVIKLVLTLVR